MDVKTVCCAGGDAGPTQQKSFGAEIEKQQKEGGTAVGSAVCVGISGRQKEPPNVEVKLCSSIDDDTIGKCCQGYLCFAYLEIN